MLQLLAVSGDKFDFVSVVAIRLNGLIEKLVVVGSVEHFQFHRLLQLVNKIQRGFHHRIHYQRQS